MSVCILCNESSGKVTQVATCANKCEIYAHDACFKSRRSSTLFRKKHHDRGNHDAEICLASGCCAKFIPRRGVAAPDVCLKPPARDTTPSVKGTTDVDDPDCPCSFMGNDGLPCRRAAIRNGACRVHSRNADLMLRMVKDIEREDVNKGVMTDAIVTTSAQVQTEVDTPNVTEVSEVQRNMEAVIRHYESKMREMDTGEVEALRRTNMDLLSQMESLASRNQVLETENATLVTSVRESEKREAEARKRLEDATRSHDRFKKSVRERAQAMANLAAP